ncbi:hypothetical protein [Flavobacterium hercynium]|uniref:hypothetical protein n=1 Tax=Flavobacterium hercynium TaxID=387094 RepID=UPI0024030C45|nr:hypothetical protein [Flavobacterium hercynium]SMP29049.1 hypothetical protein SAMN06265346_11214 [Flavobacterium hercynium]
MKKIFTLILTVFLLISCERKQSNFSEEMIEKLAYRGKIIDGIMLPPPPISFSDLYVNLDNDEILLTNSNELFFFYKKHYSKKFKSFKEFLSAVLNDGFVFDRRLFKKSGYLEPFRLNSKIEKEYKDLGFDEFFKKYSRQLTKESLVLNRLVIKENEDLTIGYILFKNGYNLSLDCHLGNSYIRKREDVFK